MACVACQDMKTKCEWLEEESRGRKVCQRKWAVEESVKGKKKRKKMWMELEAGLSGGVALRRLQTSSRVIENLSNLMRVLLWQLDCQNALLSQLV